MAGDTFLAMVMMVGPPALTVRGSAAGRTATFSMTGFSTTSPDSRPEAATNPRESAEPISPATSATAQVWFPDESDGDEVVTAAAAGTFSAEPTSEGWRQRRSSGGSGAPPTGASSSSSASKGTKGTLLTGVPGVAAAPRCGQ